MNSRHRPRLPVIAALLLLPGLGHAQTTPTATPVASASASSLSFSALEVGRAAPSQSVTVSNTGEGQLRVTGATASGPAAADFSIVNGCRLPLGKNQRCTIGVSFKPSAAGSREATLTIATSDKPLAVKLTGTLAATAAKIALSPATLSFGSVNVGSTSAVQKLTLSNSGSAEFAVGDVRPSGPDGFDFQVKSGCQSKLAAGSSCEITVTFSPKTPGDKTASLSIAGQAIGSPATARLTGTGVGAKLVASTLRLAFAEQANGTQSAPQSVTLSNGGNAALTFSKIALSGTAASHFSQTNTCSGSLAPGANCSVTVVYKPTAEGPKLATLSISGNFGSMPALIALFADGKKPMQGGLWRGKDPISGKPVLGLVAENGAAQFVRDDGVQYFGLARIDGEKIDAALSVGAADALQGSARLQGSIKSGVSITAKLTLTPKTGSAQSGDLALNFDALYRKPSALDKVAGNYKNAATGATLNISSSGVVFSQDAGSGCVINGAVAMIDARFNAYGVKLSFTGCKGSLANLNTTTALGLLTLDDSGKTPRLLIGAQSLRPGYAMVLNADKM
ncbi:MAG: choice-of-anchor D domain-containing protein [Gammaproteobacteria bacterium]|nr:choice-of-anchor D domain-containing protein [Gammaproteobacteria bacterium]